MKAWAAPAGAQSEAKSLDVAYRIQMMTAGAAPPAAVLERMDALGFDVTHAYGLTEVYGPNTVCDWHEEWNERPTAEQAALKARALILRERSQ